jgi:hypothetical protein
MERGQIGTVLSIGMAMAFVTGACTSAASDGSPSVSAAGSSTIPQPDVSGLSVAPDSQRVDLAMPIFSDPTTITNPLFPVSRQESVLLLGHVDGKPFRTEVTLLPYTEVIQWGGQRVEVAVSQYNAFLGGRIEEVAYDLYAQADDGSVWYFGEDVYDFRDGAIIVTEGTWQAGRDGPAAMIMPGDPQVGDVYRTENAPPFVFEEVTVKSVTETLDGPLGRIDGGMTAEELHMDGGTEAKTFAPGYGEFYTAGGGDVEALALAVPTDAASEPMPPELGTLSDGALHVFDAAGSGDWRAASATVADVLTAWRAVKAGEVPRLVEPVMTRALQTLDGAVDARGPSKARDAAIDVARSSFDLQLSYRPPAEVDLARLDLWAAQLLVDAAGKDADGVGADQFAMDYVRDRITQAVDAPDLARINEEVGAIQIAVVDEDLSAAAAAARRLRDTLAGIEPRS